MNEITAASLSRMSGVSRARISVLMKADPPRLTIIEGDDGKRKIDLDGHLTAKFLKGRKPKEPTPTQTQSTKKTTPPNPYQGEGKPPDKGNNTKGTAGHNSNSDEELNLKEENLELKNEKLRVDIGQTRGKLIEKRLVVSTFDQLAAIDENQFKSLSIRVGPKIEESLAESYDEKSTDILQLIGKETDPDLKIEVMKIMNNGGPDRIRKITEIIEEDTGKVLKNIQYVLGKFLEGCEV